MWSEATLDRRRTDGSGTILFSDTIFVTAPEGGFGWANRALEGVWSTARIKS
jgi:hypothetical protein